MNKEITDAIKKKAEKKYKYPDRDFCLDRKDYETSCALVDLKRIIAEEEQKDAIEFIPDLLKWWDTNAVRNGEDEWTVGAGKETKRYTTDQLLSKYINSLTDKKD